MRALSPPELLEVWERGLDQGPLERALSLLKAACPESSQEELASLVIGRRDACLLTLREWAFGPQLAGVTACQRCGQQLEITLNVSDLRRTTNAEEVPEIALSFAGFNIQFRPPNSMDLAACAGIDIAEIRKKLFVRCLTAVRSQGEPMAADQIPEEVVQIVIDRMSEADPQADIQIDIFCPACDHHWHEPFDIVSYFWSEIDAWARRVLREVHALASAYGWRESDILALSPFRRQIYLEMMGV